MSWWWQSISPTMPRYLSHNPWQPRPLGQLYYGLPEKVLLDQGRNFESKLIADLCRWKGTKKLRTSQYHAQTNCQCERFSSTLISMLGTLPSKHKSDWKGSIGVLVHAYDSTWNSATGFSPYFLMYGRQPWLPINVTLGLTPKLVAAPTSTTNVQKLRECVRWAIRRPIYFNKRRCSTTNRIMTNIAGQWPWGQETWFWSTSPPSGLT